MHNSPLRAITCMVSPIIIAVHLRSPEACAERQPVPRCLRGGTLVVDVCREARGRDRARRSHCEVKQRDLCPGSYRPIGDVCTRFWQNMRLPDGALPRPAASAAVVNVRCFGKWLDARSSIVSRDVALRFAGVNAWLRLRRRWSGPHLSLSRLSGYSERPLLTSGPGGGVWRRAFRTHRHHPAARRCVRRPGQAPGFRLRGELDALR